MPIENTSYNQENDTKVVRMQNPYLEPLNHQTITWHRLVLIQFELYDQFCIHYSKVSVILPNLPQSSPQTECDAH